MNGEQTVANIPDAELVRRAVHHVGFGRRRAERWVHIMDTFALGSTFAQQLCYRFGFNPFEEVGTLRGRR